MAISLKDLEVVAATRFDLAWGCLTAARSLRGLGLRRRTIVAAFVIAAVDGRLTVDPTLTPGKVRVSSTPKP